MQYGVRHAVQWCMIKFTHAYAAGESVVVARGGKGGMGVTRPTREDNARLQTRKRRFLVSISADSRLRLLDCMLSLSL